MRYDYCVVGGGIVGLATARALLRRHRGARLLLLEKEAALGAHQTGHNSGVIHSGIYYQPNSLKAELCRRGASMTREFCAQHAIEVHDTGKLIVATSELEVERLAELESRAHQNGIPVEPLDARELRAREPAVTGQAALYVASTAVVDYRLVTQAMAAELREEGADINTGAEVSTIEEQSGGVRIRERSGASWDAGRLVVCGGLQADRLAKAAGLSPGFQIVPFRGEYYLLPPRRSAMVRSLIYPVPDPELPFLGIHLTRTVDGGISVGPNAVLGWARENYRRHGVNWRDVATYLRWPGFWRMARQNLRTGLAELRSDWSKRVYLDRCRRYCPELTRADLRGRHVGIRAQAVMDDGSFAHDFVFLQTPRMLHVGNAPSPAATSAMPIGEHVAERVLAAP